MGDLAFLTLALVFFALTFGYLLGCERLARGE